MNVHLEDNQFLISGQGLSLSWPDVGINRKLAVVFLRSLRSAQTGRPLFTLQELSGVVGSRNRQAASEHMERFRGCGEDFGEFIKRRRKVDAEVVEAVEAELLKDPLAGLGELCNRVGERLGREDLNGGNLRAALDRIPFEKLRGVLRASLEQGQAGVQYREAWLLGEMADKVGSVEELKACLEVDHRPQDRALVDPGGIRKLLEPGAALEEVSSQLQCICLCMTLYFWGLPLSRLGFWLGVDKSTIFRWMVGLVNEIFGDIQAKVMAGIRLGVVIVDEKWIKVGGVWHYWFVALDALTEIPVVCYLSPTRSRWACQWVGFWLKQFKGKIKAICHDGLGSYAYLLPDVPHCLCHFHFQQRITTWLGEHFPKGERLDRLKTMMKRVLQTEDKRTAQRRLDKLDRQSEALGIKGWVDKTKAIFSELLPAIGSSQLPKTTNAIERFFRGFNRFYKVRRGFHSKESAIDQLCIFLVGYLFTKRAKDGTAPIEAVWPEAAQTPLYRLINDPFGMQERLQNVKEMPKMADETPAALLQA